MPAGGVRFGMDHDPPVTCRAAACDGEKGQPIPDHAACHLYQQDWGIPVTVHTPDQAPEGAETRLDLDLRGIH